MSYHQDTAVPGENNSQICVLVFVSDTRANIKGRNQYFMYLEEGNVEDCYPLRAA